MKTTLRPALTVLATALLAVLVTAPAAFAAGGEREKIPLFEEGPRDVIGIFFLALFALGTALAVRNAVQQLSGKRDAADGKWRWR